MAKKLTQADQMKCFIRDTRKILESYPKLKGRVALAEIPREPKSGDGGPSTVMGITLPKTKRRVCVEWGIDLSTGKRICTKWVDSI